jgi:hypothetical protein
VSCIPQSSEWGADSNLFHQGAAEGEPRSGRHRRDHGEAGRRPQAPGGIRLALLANAELPRNLDEDGWKKPARKPSASAKKSLAPRDKAADKKAAQGYERERQRREREEAREEAARQKEHARRQKTVDKAQAALDNAEEEHAKRLAELCSQNG